MKTPRYHGHLRRDGDGYTGELCDDWGLKIPIRAEVVEVDGRREFKIEGDEPVFEAWAKIPLLDDGETNG